MLQTLEAAEARALRFIRRVVLLIVALGTSGMSIELLLIGHVEDSSQLIPLVLAGIALAVVLWTVIAPRRAILRLLQLTMLSFIGAGIIGIALHFQANSEFQREMDPAIAGWDLFWSVVQATAPPALAPGVMIQLGLLGLASTYKHPALGDSAWKGGH
jgi:hypothetical protein